MIDIRDLGLSWRGYPVTLMGDGVADLIGNDSHGVACRLHEVISAAADTAEPGEPADWLFESELDGERIWIERFGGYRDDTGHHGGQWSVFLPSER